MSELTVLILITYLAIMYLIGRYFKAQSNLPIDNLKKDIEFWREMYLAEKDYSSERRKLFNKANEIAQLKARVKELEAEIKYLTTKNATLEEQLKDKS